MRHYGTGNYKTSIGCNSNEGKKRSIIITAAIVFFSIMLITAFFCVDDYGATVDESLQRTRSLVAYKHINKVMLNRDVPGLESVPSLEEFDHRYYGVAIQIPMVLVEDINGFTMTSQQIYLMRHCLTFLIVYIGYICLYIALTHFFGSTSCLPLIIVMMLFLYPRYFSFQFYDVKNMAFAGLSMITILTTVKAVEKKSVFSCICFGMVAAITTNCRIMGIIYPVMLLGYYLVCDLKKLYDSKGMFHTDLSGAKKQIRKLGGILGKYISAIASFTSTWYVISPFAWNDPVRSFINTFQEFAHYQQWNGTMVFMGKLIACEEMPWYYLFVWFAISVPIITLLFFIVGNAVTLVRVLKAEQKVKTIVNEGRWPLFFMLIFWGSVFAVIILKSRIYLGWHHLYFVYVPMCVVAGYGIKAAYSKCKQVISCIVAISLLYQVCWITVYHPHESSFFNAVGRLYATQFDREEWRTSAYIALNWIIESEHRPVSVGGETTSYISLSEEQKTQVILGEENPTYIINGYRNVIGNEVSYDGYDEVYTIKVDGYNVCSVFKKVE